MKVHRHFALSGMIIHLTILAFCEISGSQTNPLTMSYSAIHWRIGSITLEEARMIRDIQSIVARYARDENLEPTLVSQLRTIYAEHRFNFIGVVLLDQLLALGRLDVLEELQASTPDEYILFAKLMADNSAGALAHLNAFQNPGERGFLLAWYTHRTGFDNLPVTLRTERETSVRRAKQQFLAEMRKYPGMAEADLLFSLLLEKSASPLDDEAARELIIDGYDRGREAMRDQLQRHLVEYTPSEVPPPYSRSHDVFYDLCYIAIAVKDRDLLDTLLPMRDSANPYVSHARTDTVRWLEENVRYPMEYEQLRRAYSSRS